MSRLSIFSHPHLLGFEELETLLHSTAKSSDGFPPYNIEQTGEGALRITLAVAGFSEQDLSVVVEDRQLVIRGKQEDVEERLYLHRGIAARQFQRSFVLAEGIEIVGASLDMGLLHVDLLRPRAEPQQKVIKIESGQGNGRKSDQVIDVDASEA